MSYRIPKPGKSKFWPLPADYGTMSDDAKQQARKGLLSSWWDSRSPDILITDPYAFRVAFDFFTETYIKPSKEMCRVFPKPDCRWTPYWVNMVTHPSSALVGFRGSSKTVFMHKMAQFVAVTRPHTPICLSEFNADRTDDEISTIQAHLEDNELIQAEFGAMKPRKYGRKRWSSRCLDLNNGSQIRGVSIKAGHRGRHPLLFINDDIEKDEDSDKEEWREWYIETFFFKVIVGMLRPGSHFLWTGTFLNPVSCLLTVVRKLDDRFRYYKTISCPLIVRKTECDCGFHRIDDIDAEVLEECPKCQTAVVYPKGDARARASFGPGTVSMWPEYYSVDDAVLMLEGKGTRDQRIRAMGPTAFWTEMMNRPELGGETLFNRAKETHGYRVYRLSDKKRHIEIMPTGRTELYDTWRQNIRVTGGVDPSGGGTSRTNDFAAIVILGFDPWGRCFLLDAWQGRCGYYALIQTALDLCESWKVEVLGWEANGVGRILTQQVAHLLIQYKDEGKRVPVFVPINNTLRKEERIKGTLEVPMIHQKLLFPFSSDPVEDCIHRNQKSVDALTQQFDRYTLKGSGTGFDDLIDAYEMAYRVNQGYRPNRPIWRPDAEVVLEELAAAGIKLDKHSLPRTMWTKDIWEEARGITPRKVTPRGGRPRGIW